MKLNKLKLLLSFIVLFCWGGIFIPFVLSDKMQKNLFNINFLNLYFVIVFILFSLCFIYYIERGWALSLKRYHFFRYFSRFGFFAWVNLALMRLTDNTPLQGPVLILAMLLFVAYFFSGTLLIAALWHIFLVHKQKASIKDYLYSYGTFLFITGYGLLLLFYGEFG
ncbi:hypothetical protein [Thorsellia kenyensis]|uniref:Uncharacterized protein n=1 Tax=Thorsellia kenyensis TaxID=1549888 RepID=A0ABV6C9V7_9GAMM